MTKPAEFNHDWAQGSKDGQLAFNLSQEPWVFGDGLGLDESNDWKLPPPTGRESMFTAHFIAELRKNIDVLCEDEQFAAALRKHSHTHEELFCMVPRDSHLRHQVFAMLDTALNGKIDASLRKFTAMKIYVNQEPTPSHHWFRKFKGTRTTQIVVNLSETPFRFFRFHGRRHEDIDIDPLPLEEWSDDPEELAKDLGTELRMIEEHYVRRIREAVEEGIIYLLLPLGPRRRRRTMETFLEILDLLPDSIGGSIDLRNARIRRIYPDLKKLVTEA